MKTRALLVLTVIFFGSFIGRIAVLASESVDKIIDPLPGETHASNTGAMQCISTEAAASVKKRIAALDKLELDIADRNAELKTYEAQIEKRLGELETANQQLKSTVASHQSARDADIAKLSAIYEGMKPSQAAEIMSEMDPKFAAGLLAVMSSEQAAQVVGAMDSNKAYLVSVIMANRSQAK